MDPERRRKSRRTEAAGDVLPDHVLEEILVRLPTKSVLRFHAVCTSWRRLLTAPAFLRARHQRATRAVLLCHRGRDEDDDNVAADWSDAIYTLPFGGPPAAAPLHLDEGEHRVVLHGCCDGLLLLSRWMIRECESPKYLMYNPATREHAVLPAVLNPLAVAGFYWHPPTAEYRVLCYSVRPNREPRPPPGQRETVTRKRYLYRVAAVGRPEARVRTLPPTKYRGYTRWSVNDAPVALRGCLHWMRRFPRVTVFDTASEGFRGMRGPAEHGSKVGRLVGMDGTLGASSFADGERAVTVWVLQDYEKETWALKYRVNVGFLGRCRFRWLGIADVSDEGDALFYGARRYGVYNLRRGEAVSAGREIDARLTATWHVYQESLAPLAPKQELHTRALQDGELLRVN